MASIATSGESHDPAGDLINEIAGSLRASGEPGANIFRLAGSWGVRFPVTNGAVFHVIRRGEA